MTALPRHLLVIGAQCAAMGHLDRLEESARLLHSVLTDRHLGGCVPGLPDGRSLVLGPGLTGARIADLVREAYRFAGERGAVLVVALLGHGFTPGASGSLYYMGTDSQPEVRDQAVEVGPLLRDAADRDGVQGVVCVVDTCHAGGAMPNSSELATGVRGGSARLAVLMSCSAAQQSIDLRMSRELAAVLQQGQAQAGQFVDVATAAGALRGRLPRQSVGCGILDSHPLAREPLWLARNLRHAGNSALPRTGTPGPRARAELSAALSALDPPLDHSQVPATLDDASALLTALASRPADPMTVRATRAAEGLVMAFRTVELLSGRLGGEVTTAHLRHALGAVLTAETELPRVRPQPTVADAVDHFVYDHPLSDPERLRGLTRFVALLALETGQDPSDPVVRQWAQAINASTALNDALAFARAQRENRQLSLVVSLHASLTGDWPDSLDAWLVRDGDIVDRTQFETPEADQTSVEKALDEAVLWADELACELRVELRRLDIALPAALLLKWRPEEAGEGIRIGHHYDVVLHWSGRLAPTRLLRKLRGVVKDRWEQMVNCTGDIPLDWLDRHAVQDRDVLRGELYKGRYAKGIGLLHHPGGDHPLVELLLSYTPVFVWPQDDDRAAEWPDSLDRYWPTMPVGIAQAYRRRWLGAQDDPVADLRLVWDSGEWLAFCRSVAQPVPPSAPRPCLEDT
ncbi:MULTISPECIES: hypothetical protein [unclassified Streptomyces]|uniref:vWA-MoxR associated conflict system protein n=1 Tax=unclassified Streptomyces TaxID=2593676 RepID=UPI0004BDA59A|nr:MULTISPECIES: hypothetical protein [unclassified Streptomyces]